MVGQRAQNLGWPGITEVRECRPICMCDCMLAVDVPFVRLGNKSPPPVSKSSRVGSTFSWSVSYNHQHLFSFSAVLTLKSCASVH